MKGLCGWFSNRPQDDGERSLRSMLAASHASTNDAAVESDPLAGLAVFGTMARPGLLAEEGFMLAVAGHPRLVSEGRRSSDLSALARALRARGRQALPDVGGDYALATWDARTQRGLLAVDRIGVQALMYTRAGDALAFASTLDLLGGYPGVRRELSAQSIFDYLYFHVCPGPETIFAGLRRLAPGHCVEFGPDGASEPRAYWSMRFTEEHAERPEAREEEFVALLSSAVKDAFDGQPCGAFLSGGTDSSTIAGMLSRRDGGSAQTFSIGFDVQGFDEMAYARIAAQHFGCTHHEYYVSPRDVVDAVPKIAASYDQPFGNASAIPTYYCAKLALDHSVPRLLAGDGGDELFGGNERYARQHLLGLYQRVPAILRSALIEPLLLSTPGLRSVPPLRKLRSYVEQARPPMPQRYQSYNLLLHLGISKVFASDFLASVREDHPQRLMVETHAPFADASLINQMLGIDLRFTLADGDLPKVTHMCELAGVDVAFPLLDERLIEFSARLPADLKLRGTRLRWFFKHALRDFLPPAVIGKQKHGFGLPVGDWLVAHKPLRDLAADSIGLLRSRGIVQPRLIDDLFGSRLREHASFFGTMIWVLMMLGLWLDSRKL